MQAQVRAGAATCPLADVATELFTGAADFDGSGDVNFGDVLELLSTWGSCDGCPTDIVPDGVVDFGDLVQVLALWGSC